MSGRQNRAGIRAIFLAILLLGGCYSATATSDTVRMPARIQQVEVVVEGSEPVTVTVVARGYLPDGCSQVADIEQTREDKLFRVSIMTTRPAGMMCTAVIRNFEKSIQLDVTGLSAGSYRVDVNGIQAHFDLR